MWHPASFRDPDASTAIVSKNAAVRSLNGKSRNSSKDLVPNLLVWVHSQASIASIIQQAKLSLVSVIPLLSLLTR